MTKAVLVRNTSTLYHVHLKCALRGPLNWTPDHVIVTTEDRAKKVHKKTPCMRCKADAQGYDYSPEPLPWEML